VTDAIVIIYGTVLATESKGTKARIAIATINASCRILARVEFFGAELNFFIAVSS
jgi:hypothetical protein